MKFQLLSARSDGELGKPVSVALGTASLAVCSVAWFLVWQALPREASFAQLSLPVLLLGAVPGIFHIFALVAKIYQGVQVQRKAKS